MQALWVLAALGRIGLGRAHLVQGVLAAVFLLCVGGEVLLVTSVVGANEKAWDVPPVVKGSIVSLLMVGVVVGGLVGGPVSDSIGRRPLWLICAAISSLFGALSSFARGPAAFLACHFFSSVALGAGVPACVALVEETASIGMCATLGNAIWLGFVAGETYISALVLGLGVEARDAPLDDGQASAWRKLALWAAMPSAAAFAVGVCFLSETPHFLEAAGRLEEAAAVLQRMARLNGAGELELDCPQADERARESLPGVDRLKMLFGPDLRSTTLGCAYLFPLAGYCLFGMMFALPQVFAQIESGMHVKLNPMAETLVASFFEAAGVATVALLLYAENIEHRASFVVLTTASAFLQLLMVPINSGAWAFWVVMPGAFLSKAAAMALFNLAFIYASSAFPTECLCTALAFLQFVGHSGAALAPSVFEAFSSTSGPAGYFALNACFCLGGAVVARCLLNPVGVGAPHPPAPATTELTFGTFRG